MRGNRFKKVYTVKKYKSNLTTFTRIVRELNGNFKFKKKSRHYIHQQRTYVPCQYLLFYQIFVPATQALQMATLIIFRPSRSLSRLSWYYPFGTYLALVQRRTLKSIERININLVVCLLFFFSFSSFAFALLTFFIQTPQPANNNKKSSLSCLVYDQCLCEIC